MSPPLSSAAMCSVGDCVPALYGCCTKPGMAAKGAACRSQAAVSRQMCGGRGKRAGSHYRDTQAAGDTAGATLPYLTNGNVATVTAENTETEGLNMDADALHSDDYELYNRRTTDYGNGRIEIASYHSPRIRHTGSRGTSSGREADTSDEAQEARTRGQIYAIRRRIKGYTLSNDFRWFVTLTFDPEKIDSSDYETAKTTLLKWFRKMRDNYGKFDYLMIPELHKSGAVHFHGLLGGISADFTEAVNPKTGEPLIRHERQVYNLKDWYYGFSDCEEIESRDRAASYITKYITSALLTDKKMYNKKRYFNSQELKKPVVSFSTSENIDLDSFTPNFGIIETGMDGRNVIDIGIYNLKKDPETGALSQTDTGYFIAAKAEHKTDTLLTEGWKNLSLQAEANQQQYEAEIEKYWEAEAKKNQQQEEQFEKSAQAQRAERMSEMTAETEHDTVPSDVDDWGELPFEELIKKQEEELKKKNAEWLKNNEDWLRKQMKSRRKKEEEKKIKSKWDRHFDEVFSKMHTEWQQSIRGEEEHEQD